MKRLLLWTVNVLFLMTLSATYAASNGPTVEHALSSAELNSVTAGICRTCKAPPPEIPEEGEARWELWNSRTSTPVISNLTPIGSYNNSTGTVPITHSFAFNDECRYRITGGSMSLGTSLGISFNTTYNCARTHNYSFTVPPKTSVTIYKGTMSYYVTNEYRLVIQYSSGYQERTGMTETTREEYTYAALDIR